jgi:O-antigen ligase
MDSAKAAVFSRPAVATHLPWIVAVLAAPFWFGGVSEICQVTLALLVSGALLWNFAEVRSIPESTLGRIAFAGLPGVIIVSLLPISRPLASSPEFTEMAAESTRLSFASGETVLRGWQIAVGCACFALSREAVRIPGFPRVFSAGLALAIIFMAGAEVWRVVDGHGVWGEARHYPGGTFANRNHFASWMTAGAMFVFGAFLRKARKVRSGELNSVDRFELALFATGLVLAMATVLASGSRGGALALAIGLVFWAVLLWRERSRGLALSLFGGVLVCAMVLFALAGDTVMSRISTGGLDFKIKIWREAFDLFARFPYFGIGLGAFADVFSVFKTFHGEGNILFVENEYLQWIVETGAIGGLVAILVAVLTGRVLVRAGRTRRLEKRELFFGAVAALGALLAHALFEFVFHVPSVMMLGSALLGIAVGLGQRATRTVEPAATRKDFAGNLLLLLVVGGVAAQQLRAMYHWASPDDSNSRKEAVELWPLASDRAMQVARAAVVRGEKTDGTASDAIARSILDRAIAWRPYNWELRLERAWLDIAFGSNSGESLAEARRTILLNPLQPKIPLRFAAALAARHPEHALEFVRGARISRYEDAREALRIAWSITNDAALLWELTPATNDGLRALAQFAREQNLNEIAEEAERRSRENHGNHH